MKMPKSILAQLGQDIAPRKNATYKEIQRKFAYYNYTPKTINKWVIYYCDVGLMTENEDGTFTYCMW